MIIYNSREVFARPRHQILSSDGFDPPIGYLYLTHDIASARYIGDGILVMYAGYMVEGGDSAAIIREPAHPLYTAINVRGP